MSQLSRLIPTSGPGSGTVTSISAGTGITLTPNPITTTGTVALTVPVVIANGGTNAITFATTNGTVYYDGTRLVTTATGTAGQVLTSNGAAAPTYQSISASGAVVTLTGNSGGAVSPTAGNINVISSTGEGSASIIGNPGTSTLTLVFTDADFNVVLGTSTFEASHTVGVGQANVGLGDGVLNSVTTGTGNTALGFDAVTSVTSGGLNIGIGANALNLLTTGSSNIAVGAGMNSLVSGSNNIAIGGTSGSTYTTNESNNILIQNVGVIGESNTMRLGTAGSGSNQVNRCFVAGIDGVNVGSVATVVTESATQLGTAVITAGTGISVTPGANTITIAATGMGAFAWSVITVNQTAAVNNGYFCNKAGTLALALPATSAVGDTIEVTNENTALGVQFTQAAGQQILIGNTNTTLGATGTLTSSAVGDTLKIVCKVANTIWRVTSIVGNWTPA